METNHFALDAEQAELLLFAFDEDLDTIIDALPFGEERARAVKLDETHSS
jgi:hypothetical protein